MTTWLCGVERRWTMAAPSCFVTTFRRNLENELPADTEQCPPSVLALGLDHADFLAAMAPKPVIVLAKEKDFFDVRGSIEAYERLKHLYTLLGAPDNVQLFIGPTTHGYTQENREAMYGFFNRVTGASEGSAEPELTIEKDEDLWCTPHGQVAEMKPATVVSFTAARSKELAKRRQPLEGRALKEAILDVLRLPEIAPPAPDYRILRPARSRQYGRRFATQYAVETEPGIQALVTRQYDESHVSRPPQDPRPATLYVSHHSADAELRDEPFVAKLLEAAGDGPFYACDLRGIGESRPDTCGTDTFLTPYGSDYFYSAHGLMLDRPYVGQKTYDLVCVLKWLRSLGHREVHLAAKGWGAIPAAFAAVLAEGIASVQLHQGLQSYTVVAESEDYQWPFSTLAPGILARFDLPDCYRALSRENKLKLSDMQGAVPSFESKAS
jgi:pimeloyl-ACP methyl ester carboxylesterase